MTANRTISAMDFVVKLLVGILALTYLFGWLWFASPWYAIVFFGLCFRFTFIISGDTKKWKIAIAFLVYLVVMADRAYDMIIGVDSSAASPYLPPMFFLFALISALAIDIRQVIMHRNHLPGGGAAV